MLATSGEIIGQALGSSLVPGVTCSLEGWLHQALRSDLNFPGGYDLWLDKGDFEQRLYVGHLGDPTSPTDSADYTRFGFTPLASGSWGTYPSFDDARLAAVPGSPTLPQSQRYWASFSSDVG